MFLIPETIASRVEPTAPSNSRVSTLEHPDSLRAVGRILDQFGDEPTYLMGVAGLESNRWASTLRSVGLATLRARSEMQQPGYSAEEFPVLDRLAAGLIEQLFRRNYGNPVGADFKDLDPEARGYRKSYRRVSLDGVVARLNSNRTAQADRFRGNRGELEFTFQAVGKVQRLIFQAEVDEDGCTREILGVKRKGRGAPVNSEASDILNSLNRILQDQSARRQLAELFLETPRALAPSAAIVAEIERDLRIYGFAIGDYNRSSLGAGFFPHSRYYQGPEGGSGPSLIFEHCDSCHSLRGITADGASAFQLKCLEKLTAARIEPWHRDICGKTAEQVDSKDARDRRLQEVRARAIERKKMLEVKFQSSGNPDIQRRQQ